MSIYKKGFFKPEGIPKYLLVYYEMKELYEQSLCYILHTLKKDYETKVRLL